MLSVHHDSRSNKHPKSNKNKNKNPTKKTVKVVYISNPMKVKTSASEFSALVQELTGQDADVPDASKFSPEFEGGVVGGSHRQEVLNSVAALKVVADHDAEAATSDEVQNVYPSSTNDEYQQGCNEIELFHGFDNVEMSHQMLENNFPGSETSNLWYEN